MRGQSVWGVARRALMASACVLALMASGAQARDDVQRFDIAAQPLSGALTALGEQAGVAVFAPAGLVAGRRAAALSGDFTPMAALDRLLEGSGLRARRDASGAIVVEAVPADDGDEARRGAAAVREQAADAVVMEQMVVTGTNIRGARSAAPVFVYDRTAIDQTGLGTLPQFMRTLPQVFGGGASDATTGFSAGNDNNLNLGQGAGVNLRGLGTDSTLVLLDGRRMSASGFGEFVDVSAIPLAAIERVEVLTDGASAIYGSDAVGGVVNFVLREDYEGAESRARYGLVTEGDLEEVQLGQVLGTTWDGGHGLLSYEFHRRTALDAADRSFSEGAIDPTTLLPKQTRHGVFANAGQDLSDAVNVFANAFYSTRDTEDRQSSDFSQETAFSSRQSEQYGATVGLGAVLGDSWYAEFSGTYGKTDIRAESDIFNAPADPDEEPIRTGVSNNELELALLEGKVDGTLFRVPGGGVKAAVGGQYRREGYKETNSQKVNRDIFAFYIEVFVPIFGDENSRTGIDRLELSVAGRYEQYDDFGSSADPKVGLLWSPVSGLNIRGTFGTSFRAPLLNELQEDNLTGFLFPIADPQDTSQTIPGLIVLGNNAELEPETATTWTAGFDINPIPLPELSISMNYFNIQFENRITNLQVGLEGFADPRVADLVTRNPNQALLDRFTSNFFQNFSPFEIEDTVLLFDRRLRNLASVDTSGLDLTIAYGLATDFGDWNFTFSSTYLFEQAERIFAADQPLDVVDTVNRPADLRMNFAAAWNKDGFGANVRVLHTGAYTDVRSDPAVGVDSWTTVDLNLSYDTAGHPSPWLRDVIFSISVQNLFGQNPPFVEGIVNNQVNFDPDNASALNRFIAFQVVKKW